MKLKLFWYLTIKRNIKVNMHIQNHILQYQNTLDEQFLPEYAFDLHLQEQALFLFVTMKPFSALLRFECNS